MDRFKDRLATGFAGRVKKKYADADVWLFGSRARNDQLNDSDYDFIVISDGFKGTPFVERTGLLQSLWKAKPMLETLCYTPQEFKIKKKQIGIVSTALSEGIQLA